MLNMELEEEKKNLFNFKKSTKLFSLSNKWV